MILKRAIQDTFSGVVRPTVVACLGFVLAFGGYTKVLGWQAAVDELQLWLISAAGSVGAILLLFVVNLICAPFRNERDRHNETKAKLAALTPKGDFVMPRLLAQKDRFTLEEAACLLSGQAVVYGQELTGPAALFFFEIKQKILNGEVTAHGYSDQWLRITRQMSGAVMPGHDGKQISNPNMPGAWIDRAALEALARDWKLIIPGITDEDR